MRAQPIGGMHWLPLIVVSVMLGFSHKGGRANVFP